MKLRELLQERRNEILALAEQHGAYNVRIFGSVARNEPRPDSDIDFLVDFKPGYGLIDRIALIQDLQDLLGRDVDVVRERSLRERIREQVLKDAISL